MGQVGVINIFSSPYEYGVTRRPTFNEEREYLQLHGSRMPAQREVVNVVYNHFQAAKHIAQTPMDGEFGWFVDAALSKDSAYSDLRNMMPAETPPALLDYQEKHTSYNRRRFESEVDEFGVYLSRGQILYHGDLWPKNVERLVTDRPLSTSFNPQKAWHVAVHNGKAYKAGRLDIFLITVSAPSRKSYHYTPDSQHGHEREVVFASGATLSLIRDTYICDGVVYSGEAFSNKNKTVPVHVIEVELS